jgi:RNA polymerase sigma-70 factor (ECF subfamily)
MTPDPSSHPDDRWLCPLLTATRAGSADALGRLLDAFRPYLLLVANREADSGLRPKQAPSDAVQDTLLAAQQQFAQFRGQSAEELAGWLRRILVNGLIDAGRHYHADKRDIERELPLDDDDSRHNRPETLLGPDLPPDQLLIADEEGQRVRAALERLPERQAQVIILRVRDGLPYEEVGRRLGCSPDAARMLYERAREKLRRLLEDDDAA